MSHFLDKFPRRQKLLFLSNRYISFGVYLLVGFAAAFLLGKTVYGAYAQPTPNLGKFDPDIHPAIWVSHNPPVIAGSDEKVKLAACRRGRQAMIIEW